MSDEATPAGFRTRYRSEPGMIGHYPWTYADAGRRKGNRTECEYEDPFTADQVRAAIAAERDCRTCTHWTPHHRADVMHCSSPLRCVAGSAHKRQGVVQLWEARPVDAGF
jgi:hypothetical protein